MCKKVNTLQRSSEKKNYCEERIEVKVGVFICLLKIRTNTIDYYNLMVNNSYNI